MLTARLIISLSMKSFLILEFSSSNATASNSIVSSIHFSPFHSTSVLSEKSKNYFSYDQASKGCRNSESERSSKIHMYREGDNLLFLKGINDPFQDGTEKEVPMMILVLMLITHLRTNGETSGQTNLRRLPIRKTRHRDSNGEKDGAGQLNLKGTKDGPIKIDDVKNPFRSAALKWHPDKHHVPSQAATQEKFKLCVDAYKSLCSELS